VVLKVWLKVKFRAFGVTLGVVERTWIMPLEPLLVLNVDQCATGSLIRFNERGVQLTVDVERHKPE
jgi:hypothetical protein